MMLFPFFLPYYFNDFVVVDRRTATVLATASITSDGVKGIVVLAMSSFERKRSCRHSDDVDVADDAYVQIACDLERDRSRQDLS